MQLPAEGSPDERGRAKGKEVGENASGALSPPAFAAAAALEGEILIFSLLLFLMSSTTWLTGSLARQRPKERCCAVAL